VSIGLSPRGSDSVSGPTVGQTRSAQNSKITQKNSMADGVATEPAGVERKLTKHVSMVGREAMFGSAEQEVARILSHKTNYYVVGI